MRERLLTLVLAAVCGTFVAFMVAPHRTASAQLNSVSTLADIAGTGTATAIAASGSARWVQISTGCASAVTGCFVNTNAVRWGDSNISATRGGSIAPGGGQFLPPLPPSGGQAAALYRYNLNSIYYLVQVGDKVSITWGN
jgi:hypothetical protein